MSQFERMPPLIEPLLTGLDRHKVRFVVFGSGGAVLYGADIAPGDLDICPALDEPNLTKLATSLIELQARPRVIPGWMSAEDSRVWQPTPVTESNFDHLFETVFGDLDVVPRPYGPQGESDRFEYQSLNKRARTMTAFGVPVRVAAAADLVASKMARRRAKDLKALPELLRLLKPDEPSS